MNNRGRKNSSGSAVGIGIVAAILLINSLNLAAGTENLFIAIAAILFVAILGFAIAFSMAKKKGGDTKPASSYQRERAQEKAMRYFTREEIAEEAVKCTHPRGKEKYIRQLDNFLANGIIDKNEYRVLKARYEKANIPENMH